MANNREYKRILIMKPSALGDVVTALPTLGAIRRRWPEARISWLIRPEFAPLLRCVPGVDETIIFDRKLLAKFYKSSEARRELGQLIRKLREANFDLVLDLQGLFRTGVLAGLSGCKTRFGPKGARELAWMFYNHHVPKPAGSQHVVDHYLAMAEAVGADVEKAEFGFVIPDDAMDGAAKLLGDHAIDFKRYVVFICQSAHQWKCWPKESFAKLADRVQRELKLPIVGVGSAGERAYIDEVAGLTESQFVNLAGKTTLGELMAVLANAKAVVSNDTGPGQIASVFDVPLVMMIGPSNPSRIGPYRREESVVAVDAFERGEEITSRKAEHRIELIGVDTVFDRLELFLERDSASSSEQRDQ